MLKLRNIKKRYSNRDKFVVKDINLNFQNNSLNLIFGKSGSGKTTLLNIIAGLDKPTNGNIYLDDKIIKEKDLDAYRNSQIGFVFQEINLLDKFCIKENFKLAFDLCNKKMTDDAIENVLKKVSLPDEGMILQSFLRMKANQLSVGQKQRVAIARALIKDPSILILDEPTSALDEENAKNIQDLLRNLAKERIVIVSSHDKDLFLDQADQVINIESGKAEIIKSFDETENENKVHVFNKGYFSFLEALKIAIFNLKNKKIRLITSAIISIITMSLFGALFLIESCDVNAVLLRTQIDNGITEAFIHYREDYKSHASDFMLTRNKSFSDEQIETINDYSNGICSPLYVIDDVNLIYSTSYLSQFFPYRWAIELDANDHESFGLQRYSRLAEETNNRFSGNYNEVAISSLYAELFKITGLVYGRDEENGNARLVMEINSVDELIGKTLSNGLTITGIYETPDNLLETVSSYLDKTNEEAYLNDDFEYIDKFRNGYSLAQCLFLKKGYYRENLSNEIEGFNNNPSRYFLKFKGDYNSDYNFLESFKNGYEYVDLLNPYYSFVSVVYVFSGYVSVAVWGIIIVLIIISLAMSINLFYANVKSMERDLGLFKAMGASKLSIASIISLQTVVVSLGVFILTIIALAIIAAVVNATYYISLISITYQVVGSLILLLVLTSLMISLLASRKALRQRPINIIENK